MKVLHFYKTYIPESIGGVESVIFQLATHLPDYGVNVDVLSLAPAKASRVIQLPKHTAYKAREDFRLASTIFSVSAFARFKELAQHADLVHYHFPWPFMDLVHLTSNLNKPTVLTYHSDIVRQKNLMWLYKPLMMRFMKSVSKIVATSPNYLFTSEALQNFKEKVVVIPLGVDKASYPAPSSDCLDFWRDQLGEGFFVFVGVLRYYKGLNVLLDALAIRPFPVVIIGSGPMEEELKRKGRSLGLQSVTFLGRVSDEDKIALIQLSKAMLFPSDLRSEAFGVSLLEGAMCGKPMISCEIGTGTSYVNVHGLTGLVVPPGDKHSLSDAMATLWENPELGASMGLAAERRYEALFTADKMSQSYLGLYTNLLADRF